LSEWIDFVLEAQKLQQSATALDESEVATKALLCLEGAMYLILTGMSMEKSPNLDSEALKMYVDTLDLIGDIGSVFSTELGPLEAKIVVLTTRCQSLLLLKLFQFNTRLGTNVVWYINDYLQRCPVPKIVPMSQSSGKRPPQIMAEIPYQLYEDFNKVFATQMALLNAQELWGRADQLASYHGIEETFKQLDIQCGPLTFKSPLVDLVRYVKEAARMLKPGLAGTRK
ncbi:AF4/FMR2 family member 4, partial [Orchesella cincta]